jgi:hypothetical protein
MRRSLCVLAVAGSVFGALGASAPAQADPIEQARWDICAWGGEWAAGGVLATCTIIGDPYADCPMAAGERYAEIQTLCTAN